MRRILPLALALCLLLSACGARVPDEDDGARAVYYLTSGETGRSLGYEVTSFDETRTVEEQILDVIAAMREPLNENDASLLGEDLALREVQVFGSTVVLHFDQGYDLLPTVDRSLLDAGLTLSLTGIDGVGYVRIVGENLSPAEFHSAASFVLDDGDLRLSSFEVDVYPVDRETGLLFPYSLRIVTERDEPSPFLVLQEMVSGKLGVSAPFDGRMDVRIIQGPTDEGNLRAELYVPVEMDLTGRECDVYAIVNSLCSCRGVERVTVLINGRAPSSRGLVGCDGPLGFSASYLRQADQ